MKCKKCGKVIPEEFTFHYECWMAMLAEYGEPEGWRE
tara:strand:+ start:993 stop:1103 length:111 start_codon:yes stop_codon:yes gene_type:complete